MSREDGQNRRVESKTSEKVGTKSISKDKRRIRGMAWMAITRGIKQFQRSAESTQVSKWIKPTWQLVSSALLSTDWPFVWTSSCVYVCNWGCVYRQTRKWQRPKNRKIEKRFKRKPHDMNPSSRTGICDNVTVQPSVWGQNGVGRGRHRCPRTDPTVGHYHYLSNRSTWWNCSRYGLQPKGRSHLVDTTV